MCDKCNKIIKKTNYSRLQMSEYSWWGALLSNHDYVLCESCFDEFKKLPNSNSDDNDISVVISSLDVDVDYNEDDMLYTFRFTTSNMKDRVILKASKLSLLYDIRQFIDKFSAVSYVCEWYKRHFSEEHVWKSKYKDKVFADGMQILNTVQQLYDRLKKARATK